MRMKVVNGVALASILNGVLLPTALVPEKEVVVECLAFLCARASLLLMRAYEGAIQAKSYVVRSVEYIFENTEGIDDHSR